MTGWSIRSESPDDVAAIRDVTLAAFEHAPFSDQREADIVDALRAAGALSVSLVAVQEGEVAGHIAFSPVEIGGAEGDWYGLGPVSVRPERQGKGMGQALVWAGLDRLATLGAGGCVLLGAPAYYGRFGFESDPGLFYGEGPSPYFQRLILAGPSASGEVRYHAAFDPPVPPIPAKAGTQDR